MKKKLRMRMWTSIQESYEMWTSVHLMINKVTRKRKLLLRFKTKSLLFQLNIDCVIRLKCEG